jgi:DNA-binding LytR/AlgR family response regulator
MIKAVIFEDEHFAAEHLRDLLKKSDPSIDVAEVIPSIKKGIRWLNSNTCDLIFLDINLADGECFRIFEEIEINIPVIFTTAYDQYAIKAFELNSIDYLMKPVSESLLKRSLAKFKNLHGKQMKTKDNLKNLISDFLNKEKKYKKRFLVEAGSKMKTISVDEIAYFFAARKNIFLRHKEGKTYDISLSLEKLEQSLNPQFFFRANRSYLINIDSIKKMSVMSNRTIKLTLEPNSEDLVTVSLARLNAFKDWLNQ